MKIRLTLAAALIASSLTAQAHDEGSPSEKLIKFRQAGYTFMAWNMGKIKAQLDNPAGPDKAVIVGAANAIAGIANSGMGALYQPGTEKGKGFFPTMVKPEFFKQPDEVKKVAMAYNQAANDMAKVAASGDTAAIKTAFGKLGEACKACHDKFKAKD